MKTRTLIVSVLALVSLVLVACGGATIVTPDQPVVIFTAGRSEVVKGTTILLRWDATTMAACVPGPWGAGIGDPFPLVGQTTYQVIEEVGAQIQFTLTCAINQGAVNSEITYTVKFTVVHEDCPGLSLDSGGGKITNSGRHADAGSCTYKVEGEEENIPAFVTCALANGDKKLDHVSSTGECIYPDDPTPIPPTSTPFSVWTATPTQ